jgi:integrase
MAGLSERQRHLYAAWTCNYVRRLARLGSRPEPSPETLEAFLSGLKGRGVPAAQRREAREALTFVHDVVLRVPVGPAPTDADLSDGEKREVLARLTGADRVLARLVLESDLTPAEAAQLRVGDLSGLRTGEALQATVRDAAGCAMRTEPLSEDTLGELSVHLRQVRELYEHEREYGEACVPVPDRVEALFPDAAESWEWQFVFPAARRRKDGRTGRSVRVSTDPRRVEATITAVQTAETRIFRLR